MAVLPYKNITLRYKQGYLGIAWEVSKPFTCSVFTLVRSFVGIDSGNIPYPLRTLTWLFC